MIARAQAEWALQEFTNVLGSVDSHPVVLDGGTLEAVAFDGLAVPVLAGRGARDGPPEHPDLDVLDWRPPPWLERIYEVFGGIGCWWPEEGVRWASHSVLPWDDVTPLTRHIRFGEENITYDPADAVRIGPDGRGGGWVLVGRTAPVLGRFDANDHSLWIPADAADEAAAFAGWIRDLVRAWTEGIEPDP